MKLTELEPHFVRYETRNELRRFTDVERRVDVEYTIPVATLAEAQGIWFLCPVCFLKNGGAVGTHSCDVTFADRGALDSQGSHGKDDVPTRWTVTGNSFADLSTQPSILLEGGCGWHGYITKGEVS